MNSTRSLRSARNQTTCGGNSRNGLTPAVRCLRFGSVALSMTLLIATGCSSKSTEQTVTAKTDASKTISAKLSLPTTPGSSKPVSRSAGLVAIHVPEMTARLKLY